MTETTQSPHKPGEDIPRSAEDFVQAGWRRYAVGSYHEAEVEFGKAIELDKKRADAHYGLALAYLRLNRIAEGLEMLQKAKTVNSQAEEDDEPRHRAMLNLVINSQIAIFNKQTGSGV